MTDVIKEIEKLKPIHWCITASPSEKSYAVAVSVLIKKRVVVCVGRDTTAIKALKDLRRKLKK